MKIYEIIAKEMEKKPEERSFHFKQIEDYLKKQGFLIRILNVSKTIHYAIEESHQLGERILEIIYSDKGSVRTCWINDNISRNLISYLNQDRETLFSDSISYKHILLGYYKNSYMEYGELVDFILEKMENKFGKFDFHNDSWRKLIFHFKNWKAYIEVGATGCNKEHADEWNKLMNTKWGEEVREMTKDDLKTGMVVRLRCGDCYLILQGAIKTECDGTLNLAMAGLTEDSGFLTLGNSYSNDMKCVNTPEFDIVAIYNPPLSSLETMLTEDVNEEYCIWESKTEKEAALEQKIAQLKAKLKEAEVELEKERGK